MTDHDTIPQDQIVRLRRCPVCGGDRRDPMPLFRREPCEECGGEGEFVQLRDGSLIRADDGRLPEGWMRPLLGLSTIVARASGRKDKP